MTALLLLLGLAGAGGVLVARRRLQRVEDARRVPVEVHLPPGATAAQVTAFMRSLSALTGVRAGFGVFRSVVFELVMQAGRTTWILRIPQPMEAAVLAHLSATVPGTLTQYAEQPIVTPSNSTVIDGNDNVKANTVSLPTGKALTAGRAVRLIGGERSLETGDPASIARAVLASASAINGDERVVVQLVVVPVDRRSSVPSDTELSAKDRRDKIGEPVFGTDMRVAASAGTSKRALALSHIVLQAIRLTQKAEVRLAAHPAPPVSVARQVEEARTPLTVSKLLANATELAALSCWPIAGVALPDRPAHRRLAATAAVPAEGRVLGDGAAPGATRPVALSVADGLHHLHVLAPTGAGKSELLASLALQDAAAGRPVILVDAKGDLVERFLERVPAARRSDVVVVDPTDQRSPVGLNLLDHRVGDPDQVADLIVHLLHSTYASSWGPRLSDVIFMATKALVEAGGMTLVELPLMLSNATFRQAVLAKVKDPIILGYWSWFGGLSAAEQAHIVAPASNKLRPLVARRRLRLVLGQAEPRWTIEDALRRRQIIVVPLAAGELGHEAATLFGGLFMVRLWLAIQRHTLAFPGSIYLDEFASYTRLPIGLEDLLARARSMNLSVVLAHQNLGQLDSGLKAGVLANARSRFVMQCSYDDAAVMARVMGTVNASDLMQLPAFEGYAQLLADRSIQIPVSVRTRKLGEPLVAAAEVRYASASRFGLPAEDVEAAIAGRAAAGEPPSVGRRRGGES